MKKLSPSLIFGAKLAVVGGLAMFICMASGELFVDANMFKGFLKKPGVWPLIFLETAICLAPFLLLAVPVLKRLKNRKTKTAVISVILIWTIVGLTVAAFYKIDLRQVTRPDIFFGWTLPFLIILGAFVFFSLQFIRRNQQAVAR